MMTIKKSFVTALLAGLAIASFAQTPATPTGSGATAHTSHKKAASATKPKSTHHKHKHAKKHHSAHQPAKKKAHSKRAANASKTGSAGPGLQAY